MTERPEQCSLFDAASEDAPAPVRSLLPAVTQAHATSAASAADICGYASIIVDVPSRALSEPFAYAVPQPLDDALAVGTIALVPFGGRVVAGYVIARADALDALPGTEHLDSARVKPVRAAHPGAVFSEVSAQVATWMSRTYVAAPAECFRLFLPPGATLRVCRRADGSYDIEPPRVSEIHVRVVELTELGRTYTPPARATRQRQLIEALGKGPVTTHELNALFTDMSAAVRALAKKGVVAVTERRFWRGTSAVGSSLSSARATVPERLTAGQEAALAAIERARTSGAGDVVLVDGVTGSGKTEVYLSAIERTLAAGRSACVLVPEISLTAQTVGRFRSRFGDAVAVFHSRLSAGERLDQWDMVRSGTARVVVGARSALFCPFQDLGIIIIDEEHEQSYKQGSSPRYHAREVAAEMARRYGCPLVLGSATPSAEALARCRRGEYRAQRWERVEMRERPGGAVLPDIIVADLRREFAAGSRSIFSKPLYDALMETVERGEKAVLLHNRRGFAPFLMCRECGCVPTCKHCSTALTYHERTHTLECHTCGAIYHVRPYPAAGSRCPQCGSPYLAKMGLGTQQVEDALRQILPAHVEIVRMDADSTRGKDGHACCLERFDAAGCAVLLGTQMIAKGLDFPEVTLVGVVNADYALKMPDFRASERAYDLLEQVAGRAGRGARPGKVVIQTYLPRDPVICAVASHDRTIFTEHDRAMRAEAGYPPFVRLARLTFRGQDRTATSAYAEDTAQAIRRAIADASQADAVHAADADGHEVSAANAAACETSAGDACASAHHDACGASAHRGSLASRQNTRAAPLRPSLAGDPRREPVLLGPAPCVIERAKDRYRFHLMLKCPLGYHISDVIAAALAEVGGRRDLAVSVDIDPYDLM